MMNRVNARIMYRSLINILYVNKQEFTASSWRSNQGCCYVLPDIALGVCIQGVIREFLFFLGKGHRTESLVWFLHVAGVRKEVIVTDTYIENQSFRLYIKEFIFHIFITFLEQLFLIYLKFVEKHDILTHCGRVTQICVFTLQLWRTGDTNLRFLNGETRYICKFSLVPLHKGECFQRYHTLKHY
jgi:hypothetical protein